MKLLDRVRDKLRFLHDALETEKSYLRWIEQFIRFHKVGNDRRDLREPVIEAFLTHLAVERRVAASTQNQAFGAILVPVSKQALGRPSQGFLTPRRRVAILA